MCPAFNFFPFSFMPSDACAKFLIDIGLEIVILYEDVYEIFGDIHGAHNSFNIEAYEQGTSVLLYTLFQRIVITLHYPSQVAYLSVA